MLKIAVAEPKPTPRIITVAVLNAHERFKERSA
jgi:hypothetical protein